MEEAEKHWVACPAVLLEEPGGRDPFVKFDITNIFCNLTSTTRNETSKNIFQLKNQFIYCELSTTILWFWTPQNATPSEVSVNKLKHVTKDFQS